MSSKQKWALTHMKRGFKVWVLTILAGVMVAIVMMPLLILLGFTIGIGSFMLVFLLALPLSFLVTGWVFKEYYNE